MREHIGARDRRAAQWSAAGWVKCLRSVVVSHDGFQDLVHDRGKNTLVVVSAKFPVDLWQVSDVWLGEHTQ